MEIKNRIKLFIKKNSISVRQFEISIGKSNGYVNNIVKTISAEVLKNISEVYPKLNTDWLLTGEGDMFKTDSNKSNAKPVDPNFIEVPLVTVKAQAGYLIGFDDSQFINELPTVHVIADQTFHGKYRCFEVSGDSMDNGSRLSIWDGDVILCREVKRELWRDKLHINQWFFVINHISGLLVKQIVNHDVENGTITCHSLNSVYGPDFVLKLDDVRELYNVIKITERNLHI